MKKNGNMKSILDPENRHDSLGKNPFTVPNNYFTAAEKEIRLRAKVIQLSENTFSDPAHYQNQLRQAILTRVAEAKLKGQVAEDGFAVPEGYFTTLQGRIQSQVHTQKHPRSVKPFSLQRWLPYATAACLTVGIALYAFLKIQDGQPTTTKTYVSIEKVSTEEIIDYLAFYSEPGDMQYLTAHMPENTNNFTDYFSSEEIEAYLENGL